MSKANFSFSKENILEPKEKIKTMLTKVKDSKKTIFKKSNRLALILRNGINRYAYGDTFDSSLLKSKRL